ncbi:UNVERIFIED_CONTAM: hypothetical protein Sindi_2871800 [Sesamum indicum]
MVRQYSRKRISPRCTINVDLRKVFDSVSWTFLARVLHGYDFSQLFISWIMECVCNSSFLVALNGSLHGFYPGKKGLRQGDPMSPALFLLSMEYFSRLVKRKISTSDFNFHPKCKKLKITHLLFADDLMFFSRGDLPSIHVLMECLQEFRDASGLTVNTSKSSISTVGIENEEFDGILARTEFARGEIPRRSSRKSTDFAGIFYGTLGGHWSLGRKSAIPRKKVDSVFGTYSLGTWIYLPVYYGTSTVRQTRCGCSGSTVSTLEVARGSDRTDNKMVYPKGSPNVESLRVLQAETCEAALESGYMKGFYPAETSYKGQTPPRGFVLYYVLTPRNRPSTFSLNSRSATSFGHASDTSLASTGLCQPFKVRSSGSRRRKQVPPCRTKLDTSLWHARSTHFGGIATKSSSRAQRPVPRGLLL